MTTPIEELKGPRNVFVLSPYIRSALDIRWDNPALLPNNANYDLAGVNVYRSTDNPEGPYVRLNSSPVTALFYRDNLDVVTVNETITPDKIVYGDGPTKAYIIEVNHKPMVFPGTIDPALSRVDTGLATVYIDGFPVKPIKVDGPAGKIYLCRDKWYDVRTEKWLEPILPTKEVVISMGENIYISLDNYMGQVTNAGTEVSVLYSYISHVVRTNLDRRLYYKCTTVTTDGFESRLEDVEARSVRQLETLDYIWKEAIRRNRWILEQSAHRALLFFRPWFGDRCECFMDGGRFQADHTCETCFGTGYASGYLGPVDILLAPPDQEKNLELTDLGLSLNWIRQTWTGPTPEINQRDLVVEEDNRRYTVGPVTKKSCRGMVLQQHFDISLLDETDIRYKVGVTGSDAEHFITEKEEIPEYREIKGRTQTFENILY